MIIDLDHLKQYHQLYYHHHHHHQQQQQQQQQQRRQQQRCLAVTDTVTKDYRLGRATTHSSAPRRFPKDFTASKPSQSHFFATGNDNISWRKKSGVHQLICNFIPLFTVFYTFQVVFFRISSPIPFHLYGHGLVPCRVRDGDLF